MFGDDYQDFTADVPAFTLGRFLAHAELFRQVLGIPGHIVDIGVGSGGSTFAWAKLCRLFFDGSKQVYGFDTFSGFPTVCAEDGKGPHVSRGALNFGRTPFKHAAAPRNAGLPITFIEGDIERTLPAWLNAMGPEFRVSLLNLDADLYAPTKTALTYLMPRMSPGGVVILDEYDVPDFPGEKQAVIDYFGHNMPVLRDFYWCKNPSRYFFA